MNSVIEKEKKLNLALTKLKNLNLKNPEIKKDLEHLNKQKNQLEIEKQDLEQKYKSLKDDYNNLTEKLDELQNKEKFEQKKQISRNVQFVKSEVWVEFNMEIGFGSGPCVRSGCRVRTGSNCP